MTDLSAFLGKPWVPAGDGPLAFDCWGLTRAASRALYDRALPDLPEGWLPDVAGVDGNWRELAEAKAGAVVALGNYRGQIRHVCLSLGGNRVLNTSKRVGCHVGSLALLRQIYPVVRFYEWA